MPTYRVSYYDHIIRKWQYIDRFLISGDSRAAVATMKGYTGISHVKARLLHKSYRVMGKQKSRLPKRLKA